MFIYPCHKDTVTLKNLFKENQNCSTAPYIRLKNAFNNYNDAYLKYITDEKEIWQQLEKIYNFSCANSFITFLQENPFCALRTILDIALAW